MKLLSIILEDHILRSVPLPDTLSEEMVAFVDQLLNDAGCKYEVCVTEKVKV